MFFAIKVSALPVHIGHLVILRDLNYFLAHLVAVDDAARINSIVPILALVKHNLAGPAGLAAACLAIV